MHYASIGYTITQSPHESLRADVQSHVVDDVPAKDYTETDRPLPLKHSSSVSAIVNAVFPHADGSLKDNAVYVLECLQTPAIGAALHNGVSATSAAEYADLDNPDRVIYVGVTRNMIRRLHEHLNAPGDDGAYFTALYRPIRVLNIGWFRSYERANRAEAIAAGLLRDRHPDDFVAYPG